MATAYRASAMDTLTAGGSMAVTKPIGTAQGDFAIVGIGSIAGGTITPPVGGWVQLGTTQTVGTVSGAFFGKLMGASEPATWTFTSAGASFMISGAETTSGTNPIITGSSVGTSASGTNHASGAVTTLRTNASLITFFISLVGGVTYTPPAGETERQDAGNNEINDEIQAAAGSSGTKTAVSSIATQCAMLTVAIEESGTWGAQLSHTLKRIVQVAA